MLLHCPPIQSGVENKDGYGSLRLFNISKSVLQVVIWMLEQYKEMCDATGGCRKTCMENIVKTWNISGTMPPIFFNLLPCVWENNGLLNEIIG